MVPAETVEAIRSEYLPEMPPVDTGGYLLAYFLEVGPAMAAGMGSAAITHQELRAFQDNIGLELAPWEIRILRRLSNDYLNASYLAEKSDCRPPWLPDGKDVDHSGVARSMQQAIRQLANL